MTKVSSSLSKDNFNSMISGGKNYIPGDVSKELKSAGLSFQGSKVSKRQAMKALEHLEEKGMLPRYKSATQVYNEAGKQQTIQEIEASKTRPAKKRFEDYKVQFINKEADSILDENYDRIKELGAKRVLDKADEHMEYREAQIKEEREKRKKIVDPKKLNPQKPDITDLPDMPIDFGS